MLFRASLLTAAAIAALAGLPANAAPGAGDPKVAVSGAYTLDPNHASVIFKLSHLGFSYYTGRFDKLAATLNYSAADPSHSRLDASIETDSVDTGNGKLEDELRDEKWFNTDKYPQASFKTSRIEVTGPTTGKVIGYFTLMGQTHELELNATFVGAGTNPMTQKPVIGFSAAGTLKRSDYGLTAGLPMVGDDVTLQIEAEFDGVDAPIAPVPPVIATPEVTLPETIAPSAPAATETSGAPAMPTLIAPAATTSTAPTAITPPDTQPVTTVMPTIKPPKLAAPAAIAAPVAPAPAKTLPTTMTVPAPTPAVTAPAVATPAVIAPAVATPAATTAPETLTPASAASSYYPVPVKK